MKKDFSISSKLPKVGTSIFSTMSALAAKHQAVNLSQGFPDFDVDPQLINLVTKYMKNGLNQYSPSPGVPAFREVLSKQFKRDYNNIYNPDSEVTICSGATQAIATVLTSTIKAGDEVILFTPAYDCYAPYIELNGGKPVFIELEFPNYSIPWDKVKNSINKRTKMIIVNTPHNPSATILSDKDLDELELSIADSNILILSDEVYEHIVFDTKNHLSLASRPALAKRSFIIGSLGKTLHITGWKMGFCLAPKVLMEEFRKVHQYMVFSVSTPVQHALAEYLQDESRFNIRDMYQEKRDFFLKSIQGSKFKALPSVGTYFQLLDYSALSTEADVDYAKRLTIDYGVASIPLSVFYDKPKDYKVLRFCFAKSEKTLEKAAALLRNIK